MKSKLPPQDRKYRRRQRAIALVIVLAMVSMMTIFMLAIFSVSRTEHSSSIKYSDGQSARELADAAVNVVMAQIWDGTQRTAAAPAIWASQPGAIRKYAPDGSFLTGYKLYSSPTMQVTGTEDQMIADAPPAEWATQVGIYTDMNEPVIRPDKSGDGNPELVFPIIDPRAYVPGGAGGAAETNVEGFWYNPGFAGVVPAGTSIDLAARLPMPVQWLYVLQNGMLGTVTGSGAGVLTFVPATAGEENQPSESNPIVGRIAFWTDDEACKININTAGEPTPWYTPTYIHEMDQRWAFRQPMSFEYQRYPGHPATVAMSTVLFPNQPMDLFTPAEGLVSNSEEILQRKERIYQVMPKLNFGGSKGGTIPYWRLTDIAPEVGVSRNISEEVVRIQDSIRERLYASVDEMMFSQDVVGNRRRLQDEGATTPIFTTKRELERARFFLTAQSRAPETTMFGTPRIAMWPIHDEASRAGGPSASECRTGYDHLIAFCSSVGAVTANGANSYYFRRRNSQSPTEDINIARNRQLLTYLTNMLGRVMPGGSSYLDKYGAADTQQMVVQMFDYIRSTNLYDGFLAPTRQELLNNAKYRIQSYPNGPNEPHNRGTIYRRTPTDYRTFTADRMSQLRNRTHAGITKSEQMADASFPGHGQVVPSRLNNSVGFGRFVTVSEVGFHFICTGDGNVDKGSYRIPERDGVNGDGTPRYRKPQPPPQGGGHDPNVYSGGRTAVRIDPQQYDVYDIGPARPLRTPWPRRLPSNGNNPGTNPTARFYESEPHFWYSNYPPEPPLTSYGALPGAPLDDPRNPRNHPGFWPENWNATLDRGRPLNVGQKRVQAMLNLEICAPMLGYDEFHANFTLVVKGLQRCRLNGLPLFISPSGGLIWKSGNELFQESGCNPVGGFVDGYAMAVGRGIRSFQTGILPDAIYDTTANTGGDIHRGLRNFELVSRFSTVEGDTMSFAFTGGALEIEVYAGHAITPANLVQVINVQPPPTLVLPVPELVTLSSDHERSRNPTTNNDFRQRYIHAPSWWAFNQAGALNRFLGDYPGSFQETQGRLLNNAEGHNNGYGATLGRFANWGTTVDRVGHAGVPRGNAVMFGFDAATGNFNSPLLRIVDPAPDVAGDRYSDTWLSDRWGSDDAQSGPRDPRGTDVVFSMVPRHGDPRLLAAKTVVPASDWMPHPLAMGLATSNPRQYFAHNLSRSNANVNPGYDRGPAGDTLRQLRLVPTANYTADKVPDVPGFQATIAAAARYGDFDNAVGAGRDGGWLNKADTGSTGMIWEPLNNVLRRIPTAYFQHSWSASDAGSNYSTPNRQVSSPGMFGSLPTRVNAGEAWRTLLFRPYTRPSDSPFASATHPGAAPWYGGQGIADHNVMDLFWMPIVEPYAISEPFSTAGKINMNYQIVPFSHINRSTGMHAALKGELIAAVPLAHANQYLNWPGELRTVESPGDDVHWQQVWSNSVAMGTNSAGANSSRKFWHRNIEVEKRVSAGATSVVQGTLGQFENRFKFQAGVPAPARGLFRTASQICEVHLLPKVIPSQNVNDGGDVVGGSVYSVANMTSGNAQNNFWMNRAMTGDNVKERVYSNIYNKLTTQSNTFKVHFRAQVIKKARSVAPNEVDITKENAVSEYRGSCLIERKIDPKDARIPDYAANPGAAPLDAFYRFRVLETKRFTP